MTVQKTTLPPASSLSNDHYDYADSFQSILQGDIKQHSTVKLGRAFFSSGPKWVDKLFHLRNKIASILGLKVPGKLLDRQAQLDQFKCDPGERLGLFWVYSRSESEVILGEDDRHLNFRVSLFLNEHPTELGKCIVNISTTVVFHNWFGRLYFSPVRPLHGLIVPTLLKGMIKELEGGN